MPKAQCLVYRIIALFLVSRCIQNIPVYQPSNFYTPSHVNNSTPWISSDISHSKT